MYLIVSISGNGSELLSLDSLEEVKFVSESLHSLRLQPMNKAERIWFVNAHTELYSPREAAFASGTPVSMCADKLPFLHYVDSSKESPNSGSGGGSRWPVAECIALYMKDSHSHSLSIIDCNEKLSPQIICKRPKKIWPFNGTKPVKNESTDKTQSTRMSNLLIWHNASLHVHTIHFQNDLMEYRLLLDLHECPKHSSWYCARHRCAASGGQLAALQNANDFQEVLGNLIHKLKATRAPPLNSTTLLVYLDVHRELYSDYTAATSAEEDEPKSVWRWRGGHPFVPTNGLSIITSIHKGNGDDSTSLDDVSNELCGALRIEWNTSSENHSITFFPMQCSSDPPSPLTASALCSRVIPNEPPLAPLLNYFQSSSNSAEGSSSTHSGTELRTSTSTSTAATAIALSLTFAVVVLAVLACALSALVLIFVAIVIMACAIICRKRARTSHSILFCWRGKKERCARNRVANGRQPEQTCNQASDLGLKSVVNGEQIEQRLALFPASDVQRNGQSINSDSP